MVTPGDNIDAGILQRSWQAIRDVVVCSHRADAEPHEGLPQCGKEIRAGRPRKAKRTHVSIQISARSKTRADLESVRNVAFGLCHDVLRMQFSLAYRGAQQQEQIDHLARMCRWLVGPPRQPVPRRIDLETI